MNQTLSARRLWFLVRSDFFSGYRVTALFAGTAAGIALLISLSQISSVSQDPWFHRELFGYILFIWGIWTTSRAFGPLHNKTLRDAYLLLPASSLEKLLARLLAVTAGFLLSLLIFSTILSFAIECFNLLHFGNRRPFFDVLDPEVWNLIAVYMVVQSPYFLGAVWFRRASFLATSLTLVVLCALFAVVWLIAGRLAFGGIGWDVWNKIDALKYWHFANSGILQTILLTLLPLALWCIAWLRLKEAQSDHGV